VISHIHYRNIPSLALEPDAALSSGSEILNAKLYVIAQLNQEIDLYLSGPGVEERLLTLGLSTNGGGTPETTAQVIRREQEQWRAFAKQLNIEPQ
jgi:hypothetical protein